jgi:tRNA(Ile)-lysidine synthase
VKDYDCIVIKNIESAESSENFTEKVLIGKNQIYEDDCIRITLESDEFCLENIEELVYTKWLDYDKIDKLILRTRAQGDYIVIDDSGRRKKLKEYFINEKIPKEKRDRMFLLADGNHIVWIPGYRISSYYKVTEKTKHIVRVDFKDKE